MPATSTPQADRDDHAERVHRDQPAIRNGWRTWPSICWTSDHAAQHEQRDDGPWATSATSTATEPGAAPDHRDERAEEDQHTDRQHERHLQDGGTIMMPMASVSATITVARTNWVSETQATRPERVDALAGGAREQADEPRPDPVAVGEEEVRREQDDERPATTWPSAVPTSVSRLTIRSCWTVIASWAPLDRVVDLAVGGVQRSVLEPGADLVEARRPPGSARSLAPSRPAARRR